MSQKDMIGLVLAVTLMAIAVRLLCFNPELGVQVNETSKKLFL
jgi:hypothetical protein